MTFSNEIGAQFTLSRDRPAFAVTPNLRGVLRMTRGEFLKMHETNVGSSELVKSRAAASGASISTERRLLGWAVTLAGAALMVSGATIVILSVL
jgi:hypothetical protein